MKDFFRILKYVKPYLGYAGINIFFNILNIVFSLVSITMIIPFLGLLFSTQEKVYDPAPLGFSASAIKENFYALITTIIDDKGEVEALVFVCILILVMFFFRNLCRYLALYFLSPIRNGVVCDLRNDLNKKILSLPISFFTEKRKGDITARMTTDLVEIEWSVMSSLEMFFKDPLNIIIFLIALIIISPGLTLFVIVLFPITGFLIALIGKSLKRSSAKGQNKMGELLSIIDENLSGLRIIKAFDAEKIIQQNNITFKWENDFDAFYPILVENKKRHNAKPTHSLNELKKIDKILPGRLELLLMYTNKQAIGGSLIINVNNETGIIFYNMVDYDYLKLQPAVLQTMEAIRHAAKNNLHYLDFGVSQDPMAENPLTPSRSLIKFKEETGAFTIIRKAYKKTF